MTPPGTSHLSRLAKRVNDLLTPGGNGGNSGKGHDVAGTLGAPNSNETPSIQNNFEFLPRSEVEFELRCDMDSFHRQEYVASMHFGLRRVERRYVYPRKAAEVQITERGFHCEDLVYEREVEPAPTVEGDGFYVKNLYRRGDGRPVTPAMRVDEFAAYDGFKRHEIRLGRGFEANMEQNPAGVMDDDYDRVDGASEQRVEDEV